MPNLIWTAAADSAQLAGYETVEFATLRRVTVAPALAVRGVRLRTLDDLTALHGYVLEPMWRCGGKLLVEADRKLTELDPADFVDPVFEHAYTLERALYAARQIWRPAPEPAPSHEDIPGLDAEQLRAVRARTGTLQIIAPAGSGKTTVLIQRIRELLRRGVPADRILATTFNRDAGAELAQRLQLAGVRGVEARTFHSLGLWILTSEGLARNGVRQLSLGQWKRLCTLASRDTGTWVDPADARAAISDIKLGQLRSVSEFVGDETIARIYARYEAEKDFDDFDDLVLRAVRALRADAALRTRWQARFAHVLVDEYQDIEPAQELLIRILAAPQDALLAVGDDDQTLYGFRRASVRRMLELDRAYPGLERISLAHNYRCPPAVVEASRALIDHNAVRFPKRIEPAPGRTGRRIELHEPATAVAGAARIASVLAQKQRGEVVVLARTSNLLRTVALACADAEVAISAPPGVFEPSGARMALEAHLRLCAEPGQARPADVAAVFRTPNRGLPYETDAQTAELLAAGLTFTRALAALRADDRQRGKLDEAGRALDALGAITNAQRFIRYLRHRGGLDAHFEEHEAVFGGTEQIELEVLDQAEAEAEGLTVTDYLNLLERRTDALLSVRDDEHGIELTTIHRAKGRQWPRVELFACEEGQLPHRRALDVTPEQRAAGEGAEAERRLAYVAFTRAQERLSITSSVTAASRFLSEAGLTPQRPYEPPKPRPAPAPVPRPAKVQAAPKTVTRDLFAALRDTPDRAAALDLAAARIEAKLVGDGITVAQLLDAIPGLADEEHAAVATRRTALVSRLNPGAQRKLARELRALR
ncbi:ATP-dependent helicase [Solirubrobacter taibaiensis]|nr:ATP-dependent helicase [Solirubrobacter taibaiensis]